MTFSIVNIRDGTNRSETPFLINNDSFPLLLNAYLFRGRIQRRSAITFVGNDGRLKGEVGTTSGGGTLTLLDASVGSGIPEGIAQFVINGDTLTDPGGASPVTLLTTGATTGTLNRTTGVLTTNAASAAVTYFPSLPVMGLPNQEDPDEINFEPLFAFDTRYTYIFDVGTNEFILNNTFAGTANTFIWTGTDSDFFWSYNYYSALWTTNNVAGFHTAQNASLVAEGDGIRWYGTVGGSAGWRNFNPQLTSVGTINFLKGGLIILPYKNRLVILNTLEGTAAGGAERFPQRARWSQNGTPFYSDRPDNTGVPTGEEWYEDVIGKGGWIDAPTSEQIVTAQFIKDTLIVYFERSTWQLVYTNNAAFPFIWQKINTELGAESTFSQVGFDNGIFGVGNNGIISTDSVTVARIDEKIPDEVFNIQNQNEGVKRVYGIRDYTSQLVYWSYPLTSELDNTSPTYSFSYPNQILVYNYLDASWSQFDDSFTCFGYFQRFSDLTWADLTNNWETYHFSWDSGVTKARYPDVIAGNQRGFVFIFAQKNNISKNSPSIPISDIDPVTRTITAPFHNFDVGDYILLTGITGTTSAVTGTPNNQVFLITFADLTTFILDQPDPLDDWGGVYTGEGLLTHQQNMYVRTKEFNPFYEKGKSVRLNYMDIYLNREPGEFSVQFFTSSNNSTPVETTSVTTNTEPVASFSGDQQRIWHRVYSDAFGSFFQNLFTFSDDEMRDIEINATRIVIQGIIYHVFPAGRISYDLST